MTSSQFFAALNSPWVPGLIAAHLYVLFFACLAFSFRYLPDRVATQFGLLGRPKGHMSRRTYLIFITVFSVWFPMFCLVLMTLLGGMKPESVNIPHKAYWLSPEHAAETRRFLLTHSLWFACLGLGFLFGLHFVLLRANRQQPPRLPWGLLLVLAGCFAGGMIIWGTALTRHFEHVG